MSHQRPKKRGFLSALSRSSLFQRHPPLVDNAVQATSPELVGGSSTSPLESSNPRQEQNAPIAQRSIAMFSGIEQVHITGGEFIQINRDDNILRHVAFQSLPRSSDAAFNAAINLDNLARRSCTHGTRVDVIGQIIAWINENDTAKSPPVYWLTGLAGLGKTTIAYTICERLNEAHLPFASFFCSLQLDSKNSKLLVPTLCRDLAELYNSYAAKVLSILETNSKVVNTGLRIQIDELLAKPWLASIAQLEDIPTPVIVVDALDESDRGTEFLKELLHVIQAGQLAGIKFLVTSRPDPKIVNIWKSFPPNAICKLHEVDTANVQNDIEKYLREALPELEDEPELALLSQRAGGLFIYATTAVRFISPPHSPPSVSEMRSHLQVMLEPLTSHSEGHERLLVDELYGRILGDAFRDDRVRAKRLQILHTIICAESRIDMSVLADLANTDQDTVKRVVESLHAVLFVSPKDGCVYWYHASFPDFVFSEARAKIISVHQNYPTYSTHRIIDVFCDRPVYHGILARLCFSIMQESLHFNMCNLPSSYVFDSDVPGLNASIEETFPPTLRYVFRHWASHLVQVASAMNDTDDLICGLKNFLYNRLLFWIEAMNLIGTKSECSSSLKDVALWAEGMEWLDLLAELTDAVNFSIFFAGSPASKSTPHLYISALAMWHQDSAIWRNWRDRFAFIPSISLPSATVTIPLMTMRITRWVGCIAFSPDGNRIVSGSADRSVWMWDGNTGEQLKELQGHTRLVCSVAFSPDGNQIVSGSFDKSVRVWDAKTGGQLKELQGHTDWVWSVAFSPDGNLLVSGSCDKSVRVWDAKTGGQLKELQGHTDWVGSVAFSPDSNRIVSGSNDKSVRVWSAKTGEQLKELHGHSGEVSSVAFSPDGHRIVSGSRDKSVRVWDEKSGEQLKKLQGHTGEVSSVAFSPNGNRIVSGSNDNSVRFWDAKTGEQLKELQGHICGVSSVTFSSDGNRIVSGSSDNSVQVWDATMGEQSRKLQGHSDRATSVAFSPDGNLIVSGSADRSVRVWDAKTGEQLKELQGHTGWVSSVAFSSDGNRIFSASHNSMWVWDAKTGEQLRDLQGQTNWDHQVQTNWDRQGQTNWNHYGQTNWVKSFAFSPDGNLIVSGYFDESVRVWDAKTGRQLRRLQGYAGEVTSIAFSPDGNRILSGSNDRSVRVWHAKAGELLKELQGHTDWVSSVAFSPDSNRIASGSVDKSVRVWDVKTGKQLKELQGHTDWVSSVAFSPDGNRIVSGSDDTSVRVWDAKTGEQLNELRGHIGCVRSVAFSPDGNRIVSGSYDNSVRVWENLHLDTPWVVKEDGWIISGAERLVWVPSTICNVLLHSYNSLIISRNGSATISFAQCNFGTSWNKCHTPAI